MVDLFEDFSVPGERGQPAKPDIVVRVDGQVQLLIDAKCKDAPAIPDRSDIEQAVVYGTRYGTDKVMVLHAGRQAGRPNVELVGRVGGIRVYNGMVDLGAENIEAEEAALVASIRDLTHQPTAS